MKPATTLSSVFLQPSGNALPQPLLNLRQQRGTALVDMPLPTRKTENWKYSSKHLKLSDELASTLPAGHAATSVVDDSYRVVFRNGVIDPDAGRLPQAEGVRVQRFAELSEDEATALAERLDNTLDASATQMARLNSARF